MNFSLATFMRNMWQTFYRQFESLLSSNDTYKSTFGQFRIAKKNEIVYCRKNLINVLIAIRHLQHREIFVVIHIFIKVHGHFVVGNVPKVFPNKQILKIIY